MRPHRQAGLLLELADRRRLAGLLAGTSRTSGRDLAAARGGRPPGTGGSSTTRPSGWHRGPRRTCAGVATTSPAPVRDRPQRLDVDREQAAGEDAFDSTPARRRPPSRGLSRGRAGPLGAGSAAGPCGAGEGGADEVAEQRVRPGRARLQLGVELAGHEPGMVGQLDDLPQPPVRGQAARRPSRPRSARGGTRGSPRSGGGAARRPRPGRTPRAPSSRGPRGRAARPGASSRPCR